MSSRARFQPTLPAPAMITYTGPLTSSWRQHQILGLVDRHLRRADREQPLLGVPAGAARIRDPHHDARNLEPALRDLSDDQVRVVTTRGGQEHVGLLDARLDEPVDLQCGPDREA